jgi:hypothetical protein
VRDSILPALPGQQDFLPRFLTGSQAKTAFALRQNCERMIAGDAGGQLAVSSMDGRKFWRVEKPQFLNSTGFLTLTIGDYFCQYHGKKIPDERNFCPVCGNRMHFVQVHDSAEANRRFNNLNRRVLAGLFQRAIAVTERHKTGAIHFHVLGVLAGTPDIRSGLKFEEISKKNYRSAPEKLREIWAQLRDILPEYGFGRAELLPIKKTSEAVAAYVSKYIEKNICNRMPDDRRKKLVRYIGWEKGQLKPNNFSWGSPRAMAWRAKTRACAALVNIRQPEQASEAFGPRWAFHISRLWSRFDDAPVPAIAWEWGTREIIRAELYRLAPHWARGQDGEKLIFNEEIREMRGIELKGPVLRNFEAEKATKFEIERARLFWLPKSRRFLKKPLLPTVRICLN